MKKTILAALAAVALPAMALAQATAPAPAQTPAPAANMAPAQGAPAQAAPVQVPAAPLPDADPAMWVVKDADTTIYMFGTFHMLDGKQDWFNDEVKTAFDASDEVVMEAVLPENPADVQGVVMKYATDASGKKLSAKLTPETAAKLAKTLSTIGAPAAAFEMFDPWFMAMTLTAIGAQKMGMTGEHGAEMTLTRASKKSPKPVSELEGVEGQLKMFEGMPEAQQVKFLDETLDSMEELPAVLGPMKDAWAAGETEKLAEMMNKGLKETPELYKMILTDRNERWAEWIETRLAKPGTVFMAVGAGHLAGQGSVQEALAKRGFKSERVKS